MKSIVRTLSLLLIFTTGLVACAGHNDAVVNTIETRNTQLENEGAPIRVAYQKTDTGLSFRPYLLGTIAPSVASPVLMQDVLKGIQAKDGDQSLQLIQVRRIALSATSAREAWVVRNEKSELYAYAIRLTTAGNGVDFGISQGYRVFEPILKIEGAGIAPLKQ